MMNILYFSHTHTHTHTHLGTQKKCNRERGERCVCVCVSAEERSCLKGVYTVRSERWIRAVVTDSWQLSALTWTGSQRRVWRRDSTWSLVGLMQLFLEAEIQHCFKNVLSNYPAPHIHCTYTILTSFTRVYLKYRSLDMIRIYICFFVFLLHVNSFESLESIVSNIV